MMFGIIHLKVPNFAGPSIPFFEHRLRLENVYNFLVCCNCRLLWKSDYLTVFFIGISLITLRTEQETLILCNSFKLLSV